MEPTQDSLESSLVSTARRIGEQEGVGFRMEKKMGIDYSKALPQKERLNHPLVQTALAITNYFRKAGTPEIVPLDTGSTDANNAVGLGIPAIAVGATPAYMFHQLGENAEVSSIVPASSL